MPTHPDLKTPYSLRHPPAVHYRLVDDVNTWMKIEDDSQRFICKNTIFVVDEKLSWWRVMILTLPDDNI
jgi:hypothetical protein